MSTDHYLQLFQSATVSWSQRRWRACRPKSSTRCGTTWLTTRRPSGSRSTSPASWTSCRCCVPSASRRYKGSSTWGWRGSSQSHPSSSACSHQASRSECSRDLCGAKYLMTKLQLVDCAISLPQWPLYFPRPLTAICLSPRKSDRKGCFMILLPFKQN